MLVKERNDCCFVIVSKICALIQGGGVVCNWLKIEFFYPDTRNYIATIMRYLKVLNMKRVCLYAILIDIV